MYARHVAFNLKPNQQHELPITFEREVLPLLQKQHGFTDLVVFVSPDQKAIAISLWESKANAEAYSRETYPQLVQSLAALIDGTPEVRGYEVAFSTLHKAAATR